LPTTCFSAALRFEISLLQRPQPIRKHTDTSTGRQKKY
jgi:hypothetical protein